ncbi:MAG: GxxExxY protein [Anaerolineales bacterium]|nr:GxxExxY protein [Anaerolineales bacterium]
MGPNKVTEAVIGAAIEVHRNLGPGLFESTYEACTAFELTQAGWEVERQKALPIVYKGIQLDESYRLDLLVAKTVVVEIKAVSALAPIHEAQLLTYLRLTGLRVGLLINFNVPLLKDGIKRLIHG